MKFKPKVKGYHEDFSINARHPWLCNQVVLLFAHWALGMVVVSLQIVSIVCTEGFLLRNAG